MLRQRQQARNLERKDIVVRAIVGEDDAAVGDRPSLLPRMRQQSRAVLDRRRNIAAAENGGIGKTVDKIDDKQPVGRAQIERRAEPLLLIRVRVVMHGALPA
jgi:hypothetical protein